MLAWHGQRNGLPPFKQAAQAIDAAGVAAIAAFELIDRRSANTEQLAAKV